MPNSPFTTRELYEKLIATQPGIEIKGKASSYTSLNGHMFSFITKEGGLAMRLAKDEQEAFMEKHGSGPVVQHGAVMRGYVHVPETVLRRTSSAAKLLQSSIDYIRSLKPKATAKSKKTKTAVKKKSSASKKVTKKKVVKKTGNKKTAAKKSVIKKKVAGKTRAKR